MSRKNLDIKGYVLKLERDFDKDDHLNLDYIKIMYIESYEDSIKPLIHYFSSTLELSGVEKVYKQGVLIRPQFSGHRKRYEKPAIGLATSIVAYDKTRNIFKCKPLNVNELKSRYSYADVEFVIPNKELYSNISWFIDLSQIYPFAIVRIFKILYNPDIARFKVFLRSIYKKYGEAINETLKHIKVPITPSITRRDIEKGIYIVTYRCQRSFASSVLSSNTFRSMFNSGIDKLIISNTVSYLITRNKDVAYYYSIVLNYLVYKVNTFKGTSFILNQYGRPVRAIRIAGLEWYDDEWQIEVAQISEVIHQKARPLILQYLGLPEDTPLYELVDNGIDLMVKEKLGARVINVLNRILHSMPEVKQAFKVIDEHIDKNLLIEAIKTVASQKDENRASKESKKSRTLDKIGRPTKTRHTITTLDTFIEKNAH